MLMPQRFLRPGIITSERFNSVPHDAGNLFIRLLTLVDDFGRYDGRASVICGNCFSVWNELNPADCRDLLQVARMLQQLAAKRLIELYEVEGKKVLQVLQWQERIREGCKSKWPAKQNLQEVAGSCSNPQEVAATRGENPLPPSPPSPSSTPPSPPSPPAGPVKEKGNSNFAEAKLFFNKLFERNRHWTYEEEHLLSDALPITQEDYDLLNWAYSLPRDADGWAIDDESRRVMRTKESLIQLLREFPSELDKCRSAQKKCVATQPEEEEPDGWGGGYREAAYAEFGPEAVLPPLFRNLPGDLQRRVMERRKKMGAGKNGS